MTRHRQQRHLVRTKLVPPALPATLVARDRVLQQLSPEHRLTLVSAMPGFGKTALVRQWIDTLDMPVAWLSLDLLDQEPSTFWSHLLVAIGAVAPGVDTEPTMLLWERGANDRLFLSALVAGLAEVDGPIVLVLDGLPGQLDRATLEGLALLVDRVGDTLRLVATTRTDPPLPLARWRSLGWLADVREDDLRLTDDEAIAIAAAADTSFRDEIDIVALNRRVEGWPIALHTASVTNADLALDLATVATYSDGTLAARRWCDRAAALIVADRAAGAEDDRAAGAEDDDAARARSVHLHGIECAIHLLEADLDAAIAGIETHRKLAVGIPAADVVERRFPILAARVMLGARRMDDAAEWIDVAERIDGPGIVTEVAVPTLRAWHEWLFGSLHRCCELVDGALAWMAQHRVGAHHLAFDTLITGGWSRLSTGHLAEATALAERAWADAETLGYAWNQLQAGFLGARLALVTGDPARALRIIDEVGAAVDFNRCRTYTDRLVALEVEALAGSGRALEAARMIETLEPGPRRRLLMARFHGEPDRDVEALLADRGSWPALERLQAELVLCSRYQGGEPPEALIGLVAECGETGWVVPFLGFGPRVERLLRSMPLDELHPRLASTLAFTAPRSPVRSDAQGVRLTSRELTLVELLPTHLSYAEIGERLYLSVNTVKSNLKALYRKLDATTRTEAVEASRRFGLI